MPIWLGPFSLDTWLASTGTYWRTGNHAVLLLSFAAVALVLATIGLYAVVAHSMGRRRHEIAIRIAVGATLTDVLTLVFTGGMRHVLMGLAVGVVVSLAFVRRLAGSLVGVAPVDPVSYGLAAGVLLAAASLACLIPARRATLVDPIVALRDP